MARKWLVAIVGLIVIGTAAFAAFYRADAQEDQDFTWAGEKDAPEFPGDLTWLNVPEPLTFEQLRGKIVLLDFWTYGCINCMHIIPDLKRLEAEYPNELVVIGIHSAKFDNEGVTENIRQVIQRYGIEHPVVNDEDLTLMQFVWGAPAWPTLIVVDPLGRVVGGHSGEGVYDVLAPVIATMAQEYGDAGLIDPTPITLTPEVVEDTPLRFPGKVIVDEAGRRLFIADSGHNRLVVANLDNYEVLQVIGTGEAGWTDGALASAQFNTPQGMALVGEVLYVADTNNHVIRAVDLEAGTVTTVAGTGVMSQAYLTSGNATDIALRSPWDVLAQDDMLYIAMAGSHQLFSLNLTDMTLAPFAGDAGEDLIDGPRLTAQLAQPSGLASDGEYLYFADSEASAIRRAGFAEEGVVETLIGPVNEENRLFTFGDVDGGIDEARLQHPLGVALTPEGELYIADTYNSKIKLIDVDAKTISTVAGQTEGGYNDGNLSEALFDEPGGLDYAEGKLYIADTNNHLIRVLDLATQEVTSITFPNVTVLLPEQVEVAAVETPNAIDSLLGNEPLILPVQDVAPGAGSIWIDAVMPFGYKLNAQAPFTATWEANAIVDIADEVESYQVITPELPIEFPATFSEGQTELKVDLAIYWCEAINESLCFVERREVIMPLNVTTAAVSQQAQLQYNLVPPDLETNSFGQ